MLLIYTSINDIEKIKDLGEKALIDKQYNISFICYYTIGELNKCIDVLLTNNKIAEVKRHVNLGLLICEK